MSSDCYGENQQAGDSAQIWGLKTRLCVACFFLWLGFPIYKALEQPNPHCSFWGRSETLYGELPWERLEGKLTKVNNIRPPWGLLTGLLAATLVPSLVQGPRTFVTVSPICPRPSVLRGRMNAGQACSFQTPARPLASCVTLGKLLHLSEPVSLSIFWGSEVHPSFVGLL